MAPQLIGSKILMEALLHEGVETVFGYPGGAIMPVYDALFDYRDKIQHILVRHEQGASHAAEGYARVSGKIGVCLVTSGPGATNTITGIADAMMDSTPIVVIAGQVGTHLLGTDAFQECDIVDVAQPVCKWAYQIRSAKDIAWAVSRAFFIARSGRPGPVLLDFTRSAQIEEADYVPQNVNFIRSYIPVPETDPRSIKEAAALINAARKPLVLVGQGVELGNATVELRAFIEKAQLPTGRTMLGLSALASDHPLNVGMLGMHGNLAPNKLTQQCDLLIAVGMRFDDRITGKLSTYATQAKKIHFDIDPAEINKNVKVDVAVMGDCKTTLPAVTALLEEKKHDDWRAEFVRFDKEEYLRCIKPQTQPTEGPILMAEVVARIAELTSGKAVCVTDVGQNQLFATRYSKFVQPRSIITSGGMGTMGFGIPAAIGACYGDPIRDVFLFIGDGGFQMTIEELGVIMEYRVPVKIILLNNKFLGNVRQWQELFYKKRYSFTPMANPDFEKVAEAYAIPIRTVTARQNLVDELQKMLAVEGPYILQVAVLEEDNVMPMIAPGHDVDDIMLEA